MRLMILHGLLVLSTAQADSFKRDTVSSDGSTTSSVNDSDHDLSKHFCRLYSHASVYADGKIYVDGGNTYVPTQNGTFNTTSYGNWSKGMNDQLLIIDLSQSFTLQDTSPYRSLPKDSRVPNGVIGISLLYSAATRRITQFGGWFSYNSQTDPGYVQPDQIPVPSIWDFDIDAELWYNTTDVSYFGHGKKIEATGAAAYCDAPTLNKSFVFGGHVWRRSAPEYNDYIQGEDEKFIEGMLVLDTSTDGEVTKPTLTNVSVPVSLDGGDNPFGPRGGSVVHVPVGEKGILVFIGGQMPQNPTLYGVRVPNAAQSNVMIYNTFVDMYDIQSGFWFRQTTSGLPDIPPGRSDLCLSLVVAPDNSSYNIYMVAGRTGYSVYLATEEIWVLTLPTFQWILVYTRPVGRYGHSCHAIGENLVVIGGMQTQVTGADVTTCSETMPADIFNLASQNYTGFYDIEGANRTAPVPSLVVSAIGGTSSGGAQMKGPKAWDNLYLQYIFDLSLKRPDDYTPDYKLANITANVATNSTGHHESERAAIIGGAVGGAVGGCLLIAGIVAFVIRTRRKKRIQAAESEKRNQQSLASELPVLSKDGNTIPNLESQSTKQCDPTELGMNGQPVELAIEHHPAELFAPPPLSEVSASPISSPGTTSAT